MYYKLHSRHSAFHHGRHLLHLALVRDELHHLARLVELLDELVHLLYVGARALCQSHAAARVEAFGMGSLAGSHAEDNGFDVLEGIIVDVHILDGFAHTRNHACQVLEVAHLLDLLNLLVEVVEVELVLLDLPFHS